MNDFTVARLTNRLHQNLGRLGIPGCDFQTIFHIFWANLGVHVSVSLSVEALFLRYRIPLVGEQALLCRRNSSATPGQLHDVPARVNLFLERVCVKSLSSSSETIEGLYRAGRRTNDGNNHFRNWFHAAYRGQANNQRWVGREQ